MFAVRVALQTGGVNSRVGHLAVVDKKEPKGRGLHARLITCHAQDLWLPIELEGNAWQHLQRCRVRVAYLEDEDSEEPTTYEGTVISLDVEEMGIQVQFEGSTSEWVSLLEDDWGWVDMEKPELPALEEAVRRRAEHMEAKRSGGVRGDAAGSSAAAGGQQQDASMSDDDDSPGESGGRGGGGRGNSGRGRGGGRGVVAGVDAGRGGGRGGRGRGAREGGAQVSRPKPQAGAPRPHAPFATVLEALHLAARDDASVASLLDLRLMQAAIRTLGRTEAMRTSELDDWRCAAAWLRERCEGGTRPLLELMHLQGLDRLVRRGRHELTIFRCGSWYPSCAGGESTPRPYGRVTSI